MDLLMLTNPPVFAVIGLPEDEHKPTHDLTSLMSQLNELVDGFGYALQLFDTAEAQEQSLRSQSPFKNLGEHSRPAVDQYVAQQRTCAAWMRIAARDSAMTIYHVKHTLDAINGQRKNCPTLFSHVDRARHKKAGKVFEKSFRDLFGARHAVAHSAENSRPEDRKKHSALGPFDGPLVGIARLFISDTLFGRRLTATINGEIVISELSTASLGRLAEVRELLFAAFRPASEAAQKLEMGILSKRRASE
jgi:hypothetical protein